MTNQIEVIYFPKPCPHCKEPLFRVEKMSLAWSECRNKNCSYFLSQEVEFEDMRREYTECYNRR